MGAISDSTIISYKYITVNYDKCDHRPMSVRKNALILEEKKKKKLIDSLKETQLLYILWSVNLITFFDSDGSIYIKFC